MADEARKMVGEYGIQLIDIVPRQIKYSDELTESVMDDMTGFGEIDETGEYVETESDEEESLYEDEE